MDDVMRNIFYRVFRCCLVFVVLIRCHLNAQSTADVNQIFTDKLSSASGYNKNVRPGADQTQPLEVNISLSLVAIQEFDEVKEKLSIIGFFSISWVDERVTWSPASYNGVGYILVPPSDVWVPEFTLANPFDQMKGVGTDLSKVRFFPNGLTLWAPGDIMKSTCSVDVTHYPFDTQKCDLLFFPYSYFATELHVKSPDSSVNLDYYNENGEWLLSKTTVTAFANNFPFIQFSLTLERRSAFFVINVILPVIVMSFLNILVFILPADSGERVGYAITVLLSIAVFLTLVSDHMPKSSKPISLIGYYLMTTLIMSALICLFTILILRCHHKAKREKPPSWVCSVVRKMRCGDMKKRKVDVEPFSEEKIEMQKTKRLANDKNLDSEEGRSYATSSVTWTNVGQVADVLCCVFCLVYATACTTGFLVVLSTNSSI